MGGRSGKVRQRGFTTITGPRNTEQRYEHRLLIGIPTLGWVRIEWHNALAGIIVPTNFSNSLQTPIGFSTVDAQNALVRQAVQFKFDWMLLLEDDVLPPADLLVKLRPYMQHARYPVVSGLYHLKGTRPEPMIYRGRGNGPFLDWKPGQKVWADGVPTGCLLLHVKLLEQLWDVSEPYPLRSGGETITVRRCFDAPRVVQTMADGSYRKLVGTSDLFTCDRILKEGLLAKAGWKSLQRKPFPFLVDTSIRCGHIDREAPYHVF